MRATGRGVSCVSPGVSGCTDGRALTLRTGPPWTLGHSQDTVLVLMDFPKDPLHPPPLTPHQEVLIIDDRLTDSLTPASCPLDE